MMPTNPNNTSLDLERYIPSNANAETVIACQGIINMTEPLLAELREAKERAAKLESNIAKLGELVEEAYIEAVEDTVMKDISWECSDVKAKRDDILGKGE
jgi:hypothetical protein